ncbi:CDP-diacylglycerol--glycerol-3-phosphate 3-phosphatidyltransferas [Helicobacter mustelae 12198]|uniref:CDP-diacylglycerol--glycerol-3-phosphate 3-phosphatidyltransferase n=1 Tax=Helicobacter mustelae (strain ATCC 43772 / CCUG 25715 / CIP 103759 / LMG 18044 / NCTC 12198 / R85-136P) TaxID=679897 RepID=D3UGU4_HELM1|nr:CDP-diacylglycerol--glycerol-3-phosphate 3-phosphatidyltransferas [Helicobacter mustelae 12198]
MLHGTTLGFHSPKAVAFWFFLIASITDFFDGYLARRYDLVSVFGEVFDPLADKMLILGTFIGLLAIGEINPWAVFIILSREFFITGLRVVVASNQHSVRAGILGKCKTVLQMGAVCLLLLGWYGGDVVLWVATFVTLYSGLDYALRYYKSMK